MMIKVGGCERRRPCSHMAAALMSRDSSLRSCYFLGIIDLRDAGICHLLNLFSLIVYAFNYLYMLFPIIPCIWGWPGRELEDL